MVLWLGVQSAAAEVPLQSFGLPVGEIDFDCPVPIDRENFLRELPLREGEPLTSQALDQAVEWLRNKEVFSSVDTDGAIVAGRAAVRFHLEPVEVVVSVEIRGTKALDEAELRRRARIREDEPLSRDKLPAVIERVRALYREHGYPDARIQLVLSPKGPGQLLVRILVEDGEPVRIHEIEISGLPAVGEATARQALPFREGDVLAEDRPEAGRKALVRWLRERFYYEAEVKATVSVTENLARLRYEVHSGLRFEVEIQGNARIASERLLNPAELQRRPIITAGTWRLLALRMQQQYRDEGFHFAEVGVTSGTGDDPRRVIFHVREGPLVRVESVRFHGNRALSVRQLRRVMQTQPASRFSFFRKSHVFREEALADDLEQIRRRYRDAGFLETEIRDVEYEFEDDRRRVRLALEIREGPRSIVENVDVAGAEGIVTSPLDGFRLRAGEPYRPDFAEEDRRHLAARLGTQGYPDSRVDVGVEERAEGSSKKAITVHYRVELGERVRIGRIVIQQNYFTRDRVVRRELPFRTGDFFDPALLSSAQTKLYRLGLFRSVAIRPAETAGAVRDILVQVGERPGGEAQYGFGYNTRAGLRNFFQVAHRNILGTGRQLSLRGDLNLAPANLAPDEYVVNLGGKEPHFAASDYDLRANVVYQRSERAIDEFSIRRFSFSTGFEREFFRGLQGSLLVEFEDSDIFDVAPDAVLTGQDLGRLRTVSLNPILVYDGRDDAFAPTRGVFETVRVRYGSPALGSDVHFVKLVGQHSQYVSLARDVTWIYAARAGIADPLGGSVIIPLRERFFLGGRTSVRGFAENSIGPRGVAGNPVGGDLLFSANTELRFPLIWGLGAAAFVDGGGLYLRERVISIEEFRKSAGPGLRYQTPIGAISLDYGFKLDQRRGESIGEIHFTIGNIF